MTTSGMRAARAQDADAWGLHGATNALAFSMAELVIGDSDEVRAAASAAYPAFDVAGEVQMDRGESVRQTFHGSGLLPRRQVTHPQDLAVDWHPANLEVGERNGKVPVTVLVTNRRLVVSTEKFKMPRASRFSLTEMAMEQVLRRTEVLRWAAHVLLESVTGISVEGDRFRVESVLSTPNLHAALRLDIRSAQAELLATETIQALKDRWRAYVLDEPVRRLVVEAPLASPFTSPVVRALGGDVVRPSSQALADVPGLPTELAAILASAAPSRAVPAAEEDRAGVTPASTAPARGAFDLDWPPKQS